MEGELMPRFSLSDTHILINQLDHRQVLAKVIRSQLLA